MQMRAFSQKTAQPIKFRLGHSGDLYVNDTEAKRSRIKDKIAASQARLSRESLDQSGYDNQLDGPPENYRSLAAQYPWLTVAGGLAVGLLVGAMLPKSAARKFGNRAVGLATIAAELGMAFSKQARETAGEVVHDGAERLGEIGHRLDDGTAEMRARARRTAGKAAGSARSAGQSVVREALRLAARARK